MHLRDLLPLNSVENIELFSLQVGPASEQLQEAGIGLDVQEHSASLTDFAETAALIANLDGVISVDTAVTHLAAAMGTPTWVMLAYSPDWRWLRDRVDSPWYPSIRLFRQPVSGDWTTVVRSVCSCLSDPLALQRPPCA